MNNISRLVCIGALRAITNSSCAIISSPTPKLSLNAATTKCFIQHLRSIHNSLTLTKCKRTQEDEASDEEDGNDFEFKDERDSKVLKTKVNSLRADLLLKAGLGIARNKVESFFYDSKIRVNAKKISKKSVQLQVGDEIDVVRGFSQTNPSHLVISRVVVLAANEREEGLSVSLRRYKSLLIENYSGQDAYRSSNVSAH